MYRMLDTYTVSFFGHRQIEDALRLEKALEEIICRLLREKEYVEFLVGRNGEFDRFASSVIRTVAKKYGFKNFSHILMLPYITAEFKNNEDSFLEFYDDIEIMSGQNHFKSAITHRNREMVHRADLVICFVEHNCGGAYESVRYARKHERQIINISSCEYFLK